MSRRLIFIIIFLFLEILSVMFQYAYRNRKLDILFSLRLENLHLAFNAAIASFENTSNLIFETSINNEVVLSHMHAALHGNELTKNIHRTKLKKYLQETYNSIRRLGIKQLHFHFPDNTSFLRMHRPDRFGDVLTDTRPSVARANSTLKMVTGFEEGRIFNGFRFIHPLFYKNEHIGSMETSLSFDGVRSSLERTLPGFFYFMLDQSMIDTKLFQDETPNYKRSLISSKFYHEESDFVDVLYGLERYMTRARLDEINTYLRHRVHNKLSSNKPFVEVYTTGDENWTIAFLPVFNISEKHVGWLVHYQLNKIYPAIQRELYMNLVVWTLLIIMLLILIWYFDHSRRTITKQKLQLEKLNKELKHKFDHETGLRRQNEQILMQQSKMASMGEMIGMIAHQWRQPLNAIGLLVQDLEDAREFGELTDEYLKKVVKKTTDQIEFMSKTIDDFRDFFTPTRKKEPFNVKQVVEDALHMIDARLAHSNIRLSIRAVGDDTLYIFDGFKNEFIHVLLNIINNSRDAIVQRQQTNKEDPLQTIRGEIQLDLFADNDTISLSIRDNGGGIPEKNLERIFEPYFTTKGEKDGTGIGLYMSRTIIEVNMKGKLYAKNGVDGAEFHIELYKNLNPGIP